MINKKLTITSMSLILILVLSAFMRFYSLKDRGLAFSDEAYHLNAGKTYYAVFTYIYKKITHQPIDLSFADYVVACGGGYPHTTKPAFFPMIGLFFLLFGVYDYSGLFLSAVLGFLSVWIIYYIAKEMYGKIAGIFAALLLSVSPYHIFFSRSVLSQTASIFFTLAGFYCYLRAFKKSHWYLISAGVFLAIAFCSHANLIWFFPFLLFIEVLNYLATRKIKLEKELFRLFVLIASYALTFFIFIAPLELAANFTKGLVGKHSGMPYHIETYFEQARWNLTAIGGVSFTLNNIFYYFKLLKIIESPIMLMLAMLGVFLMIKDLKKKGFDIFNLIVLLLCVFPIAMWSFYVYKVARNVPILVPFFILGAAYAVDYLIRSIQGKTRLQHFLTVFLFLGLLGIGIYKSIPAMTARYNYKAAIDFMKGKGNIKHITSMPTFSVFYLGIDNTNSKFELTKDEIMELYKNKGFRFFINAAGKNEEDFRAPFLYESIKERKVKPVYIVESSPYLALFQFNDIETEAQRKKDTIIEIYELGDILK